MSLDVTQLTPGQWRPISLQVHRVVFHEEKPAEWDRISYALMIHRAAPGNDPICYVTVREHDDESVYWQFGGAFPPGRGKPIVLEAMERALSWQKVRSKRVSCLIENQNTPMLKLAMKVGFRVIGVRYFGGSILLEHLLEFDSAPASRQGVPHG